MEVAALFLRTFDMRKYDPFYLAGNWSKDELQAVKDALAPHVPAEVGALFNQWYIDRSAAGFMVRRSTWTSTLFFDTVSDLTNWIEKYYDYE